LAQLKKYRLIFNIFFRGEYGLAKIYLLIFSKF
jgi:hypothetical protein